MATFERIYWIISVIATVFLVIQLVLVFISGLDFHLHLGSDLGAHGGAGGGHEGDFGVSHFTLLTLRNLVAFFALFGWSGIALYHKNIPVPWTILLSFLCGLLMMSLSAALFFLLSKLQTSGNIDLESARGLVASVYLTIPGQRQGTGKINVKLQDKIVEMDAVTDEQDKIPTGSSIVIRKVINNQAFVERT
jgi:hypothetical protein